MLDNLQNYHIYKKIAVPSEVINVFLSLSLLSLKLLTGQKIASMSGPGLGVWFW